MHFLKWTKPYLDGAYKDANLPPFNQMRISYGFRDIIIHIMEKKSPWVYQFTRTVHHIVFCNSVYGKL